MKKKFTPATMLNFFFPKLFFFDWILRHFKDRFICSSYCNALVIKFRVSAVVVETNSGTGLRLNNWYIGTMRRISDTRTSGYHLILRRG